MTLQPHPTWAIHDSSKLTEFQRCPRSYFYRYILGWNLDIPAHDLIFGEAWHRAREVQLLKGYNAISDAYEAFESYYRQYFPPEDDALYAPKNPAGVLNALMKFASDRISDLTENEVVELDGEKMTEISGTVPIDDTRVLHYRLDSVMRQVETGKVFSWDHKTTSERYVVGRQWADQFFLGLQNGTYTHCLYCMFPIEEVLGIEFCGTGFAFLKRGSANRPAGYHATLRRVPAFKTPDQMNSWLWTVNELIKYIEIEMDKLFRCTENDPVLMAFPMNGTSCTDYRGCPYYDYCSAWQNPLRSCNEPPLGFTEKFWNPAERDSHIVKDLKWKG